MPINRDATDALPQAPCRWSVTVDLVGCFDHHHDGHGEVVNVDLTMHEAIEIVGAISDRDIQRAERLVAGNAVRLKREWTRIHGNE